MSLIQAIICWMESLFIGSNNFENKKRANKARRVRAGVCAVFRHFSDFIFCFQAESTPPITSHRV